MRESDFIKMMREKAKLSKSQLAHETQLSRYFITKLEKGETGISIETMRKICKVLNCTYVIQDE